MKYPIDVKKYIAAMRLEFGPNPAAERAYREIIPLANDAYADGLHGKRGGGMNNKLLELHANQAQAVDALCLLLDGLEHEARAITQGPFAAEIFVGRLRMYLGAFHFVVDGLEATGRILEELSEDAQATSKAEDLAGIVDSLRTKIEEAAK